MELCILFLVLCIAVDVSWSRRSYLLLAPKELKLGTDHDVIITVSGLAHARMRFRLYLFPINNSQYHFCEKRFQVTNDIAKKVTVRVDAEDVPGPADNQVVLMLESINRVIRNHTVLTITRDPGYIFIQTDKPIYTPRQTVKYRVVALNEGQHWAPWRVQIDIINPHGTLVDRISQTAQESFNAANFSLSSDPVRGTWKISASFHDQVLTKETTTFEVMEYVLPRFGFKLRSSPATMCLEEISSLNFTVEARYVYNKPVQGSVVFKLQVVDDAGTLDLIEEVLVGELDSEGCLHTEINRSALTTALYSQHLLGSPTLQLKVLVTVTSDTGFTETKTFKSTVIQKKRFVVEVVRYQQLYNLDEEYTFTVKVFNHSGEPLVGQEVTCIVANISSRFTLQETTDTSGIAKFVFMPHTHYSFSIIAQADSVRTEIYFPQEKKTGLKQFISISLMSESKAGLEMQVKVKFSHPPEHYFLLVITRGKIIHLNNYQSSQNGEDIRTISKWKTNKMVPMSRIVVCYIARNGSVAEIITAAVVVDMDNRCMEELQLNLPDRRTNRKPKDRDSVEIRGGRGMRVGLVAIDKAVFMMDHKTLTRKEVFERLEFHDLGMKGVGTGVDSLDTLLNCGFAVMTNADITFPDTQTHSVERSGIGGEQIIGHVDSIKVRSFFPESWLFQETTLNEQGRGSVEFTYPDSITTWIIRAVGVSASHGVCVSPVQKVVVSKDFFVDLYLPYKATRLEEVLPNITIANYKHFQLHVNINVTVDQGLCIHNGDYGSITMHNVIVPANDIVLIPLSIIPVMAGELAIKVHVQDMYNLDNYDSIRRILKVVTEGEERERTVTFNLDPQAVAARALRVRLSHTVNLALQDATVKHTLNTDLGEQYTDIDMSLPVETIPGSEKLRILASGDLLGDVVNNVLFGDSDDDDDDVISGEAVMLSLCPMVYSLKYLILSDDVDQMTVERGRIHIKAGITNVLKFKDESGGFLDKSPYPSTWFTSFVLQTLCAARNLTYVDEDIITDGLNWLLDQVDISSGISIQENDERFYPITPSDRTAMLAADILIAVTECRFQTSMALDSAIDFLRRSLQTAHADIENTLVLAKAAYALHVSGSNQWRNSYRRLLRNDRRQRTPDGLRYWADVADDDTSQTSLFYHDGPTADSISATSYALMLSLDYTHWRLPDRIAEWIIKWRNANGVFVGAVDTAIATLALAKYREYKNIEHTSLHLQISNNADFLKTLHFINDTAHSIKTLPEVPHGSILHVVARGVGLGQMHIDAKYNVHLNEQAQCLFNMTVDRYLADFSRVTTDSGFDLCSVCNLGCHQPNITCQVNGSPRQPTTHSRIHHCLKICLRFLGFYEHGPIVIDINMLTGYEPIICDLQKMKGETITSAVYSRKNAKVTVTFKQVSHTDSLCFGFRIKKEHDVQRLHPALISIRYSSRRATYCYKQYDSGEDSVSLSTLCYNSRSDEYSGVCHCVTGKCAACVPRVNLLNMRLAVRKAKYVFKLEAQDVVEQGMMKLMAFRATEVKKQCLDVHIHEGRRVELLTMKTCGCPVFHPGRQYFAIGEKVYRRKGRDGSDTFHFWIDNFSFVLGESRHINFTWVERLVNSSLRQAQCPGADNPLFVNL